MALDVDLNVVPAEGVVSDSAPLASARTNRKPALSFDPAGVSGFCVTLPGQFGNLGRVNLIFSARPKAN